MSKLRRGVIAAAPAPSCSFPLDATENEITGIGFDGKLAPSNDDQTGSYTIQSGLGSTEEYVMLPESSSDGTGEKLDVSSGIVVVALDPDDVPVTDGGNGVLELRLYDPVNFDIEAQVSVAQRSEGYSVIAQEDDGYGSTVISDVATKPSQVLVYFNNESGDANQGSWGVAVDDTDYGYQTTFAPSSLIPVLRVSEGSGLPAEDQGKTIQGTFVSGANNITATAPNGSVDNCRNEVNA